jgi:hypothetical protein
MSVPYFGAGCNGFNGAELYRHNFLLYQEKCRHIAPISMRNDMRQGIFEQFLDKLRNGLEH